MKNLCELGLLFVLLGGCGSSPGTAASQLPAPPVSNHVGHWLVIPMAAGETLLGREVKATPEGGWAIAESRLPGCQVTIRRTAARFLEDKQVKAHELASIGGGYSLVVKLEAKYGKDATASLHVENAEILDADVRGSCGDKFVSRVYVGAGRRAVAASSSASANAKVNVGVGTLSPDYASDSAANDSFDWQAGQAYAFDVATGMSTSDASLEVKTTLPSILTEGEELKVAFSSRTDAYLVVVAVDAAGIATIVWPSNEEPEPLVTSKVVATLPSTAESAAGIHIRPMLARPGQSAREAIIVYAFSDKRDFDNLKPASLGARDDVAYVGQLDSQLADIPARRWRRTTYGYIIQPAVKR